MDRANELMLNARTATTGPESRNAIAIELDSILEEVAAFSATIDRFARDVETSLSSQSHLEVAR